MSSGSAADTPSTASLADASCIVSVFWPVSSYSGTLTLFHITRPPIGGRSLFYFVAVSVVPLPKTRNITLANPTSSSETKVIMTATNTTTTVV